MDGLTWDLRIMATRQMLLGGPSLSFVCSFFHATFVFNNKSSHTICNRGFGGVGCGG